MWEWDSQLASEAFKLHDRVLRQYMTQVRVQAHDMLKIWCVTVTHAFLHTC